MAGVDRRAPGHRLVRIDGLGRVQLRQCRSIRWTIGMRVEPPTSSTRCTSLQESLLAASNCRVV